MARQTLSQKIRFEVFKRDSFTCQYCGAKAPDVLLQADHIEPVSQGGTNDILNLITACQPCNSGKSDRRLSDNSVLEKQREQLEGLQERKEQIEMMFQWQRSLTELDGHVVEQLAEYWGELVPSFSLTDSGKDVLKKLLKKFGLGEVMEAMRVAADQYAQYENGELTSASVDKAFNKIGGICTLKKQDKDKPYMKDLFYIRGIMRNRFSYCNEWMALQLMEKSVLLGADLDKLKQFTLEARNWTEWRSGLETFIYQQQVAEQEHAQSAIEDDLPQDQDEDEDLEGQTQFTKEDSEPV